MEHRATTAPRSSDAEAEIRRLGLRFRQPLHHGETRDGQSRWAHHQAVVWDPQTRLHGEAWSDRSAEIALTEALSAFLAKTRR